MTPKLYLVLAVWATLLGGEIPTWQFAGTTLVKHMVTEEIPSAPRFQDLEGNTIRLSDFKGKTVVLNYWATWCRPCIEEMPSLMRTQDLLKNEDIIFLLPSDQAMETIKKFVAKKKYALRFIKYSGSLAEVGINALPTTFIYNGEGEVIEKIVGGIEWDSPEMIQKLKDVR